MLIFLLIFELLGGGSLKTEYTEINEFLDDVHNELSVFDIVTSMGLIDKNNFIVFKLNTPA